MRVYCNRLLSGRTAMFVVVSVSGLQISDVCRNVCFRSPDNGSVYMPKSLIKSKLVTIPMILF